METSYHVNKNYGLWLDEMNILRLYTREFDLYKCTTHFAKLRFEYIIRSFLTIQFRVEILLSTLQCLKCWVCLLDNATVIA